MPDATDAPAAELDDRKAAILRAVVEVYIDTAQPVGSSHVLRAASMDVSPATVRNEMAALERDGYLVQPHTSAGRVPTDRGYRFFVDEIEPGRLAPPQRQRVREFFTHTHGELEQLLHETSRLLSDVSDHTAVVVGPGPDAQTIRSVQIVGLGPSVALVVAVLSSGMVEKRTIDLPADAGDQHLAAASARLTRHLVGTVFSPTACGAPPPSGDATLDAVATAAADALRSGHERDVDHVFVGGTSRMADAFDAVKTVRAVLTLLEQQLVIVELMREVIDRGLAVSVAIGSETGLEPLAECSVVVAPYEVEGERAGTIGILGPTRMNYPQAMAAVLAVGSRLGQRLTEG